MKKFNKIINVLGVEKIMFFLTFMCIVGVYALSYYNQKQSYNYWMTHPDTYVVDNVTAMSTRDAYWWLKLAKDFDDGKLGKGLLDPTKAYPDLQAYPLYPTLLARAISQAKKISGYDYYKSGLILGPWLSGLFVFPLYFYFLRLKYGVSAILGGLVGIFSWSYYSRTALGCIDTDLLNLFFPMAVSSFIMFIRKDFKPYKNVLLGLLAGLMMHMFFWWYERPEFFLFYCPFIIFYLAVIRIPLKQICLIFICFALTSGPQYIFHSIDYFNSFLDAYFFTQKSGQIFWPNIMSTIQESWTLDLPTKLKKIHEYQVIVFFGFAGILYLYCFRWKQMIPITPLLIIGLWSLIGPHRFAMYLAPFIGIGVGVLIELVMQGVGNKVGIPNYAGKVISIVFMLLFFFSTADGTGYGEILNPTLPASRTRAFLDIKRLVPKHSAMFTWWSEGYPLMEIGGFATYHDNAAHGGIRTTLIAKSFVSKNQRDMVALISCLEEYGFKGLQDIAASNNFSGDQLTKFVFNYLPGTTKDDIYILYTDDMIESFEGLSVSGTWDFSTRTSSPMKYTTLPYFSHTENSITYRGGKVDLERGEISDGSYTVPLKAALFISKGYVVNRLDYSTPEGVYLQVLIDQGKIIEIQVIEEPVFLSNFNQQFMLGNFNDNYFDEVYNYFPVARLLKLKRKKQNQSLLIENH